MLFPSIVPVFPLTGCILLPGNLLPLHIFEPRYRNMVADARQGEPFIGMIQPRLPRNDNRGAAEPEGRAPVLYRVGGLGRLEHCLSEPDGRYQILLKGIQRFRILEELPLHRGYRRFQVDYAPFRDDLEERRRNVDATRLLAALPDLKTRLLPVIDCRPYAGLPGVEVINGLSAALPFHPAEKQALLEAPGPEERGKILLTLMGMGLAGAVAENPAAQPTVH